MHFKTIYFYNIERGRADANLEVEQIQMFEINWVKILSNRNKTSRSVLSLLCKLDVFSISNLQRVEIVIATYKYFIKP